MHSGDRRAAQYRVLLPASLIVMCVCASLGGSWTGHGPSASTAFAQPLTTRRFRERQEQFQRYQKAVGELQAKFARDLEKIAAYCDENGLKLEAAQVRAYAVPLDANIIQGKNLPRHVQGPIPRDLPEVERKWRQDLRTLQTEYARQLFEKARTARETGRISYFYELVREVARQDPDHRFARQLLGFVQHENEWVTAFAQQMLRQNHVFSDKYGWLKADHVDRYQNGERFFKNEWMSAAKEEQLRRNFRDAWVIRTDHYEVKTNHSLEIGVELAANLEDFYRIFFQTFASFLTSKEDLQKLATNASSAGGAVNRRYVIHYYRTQAEYEEVLKKALPDPITGTTGIYLSGDRRQPGRRIAHFFHNTDATKEERLATMYHEATHQLFSEAYSGNEQVGVNSNFWAIEGIACYMESFQTDGERFSLGNPGYIRFQNAQYRLMVDDYYVAMHELCAMGQKQFQTHPQLALNYSQGAGLSHFFMHYEDGLYRDAFISYLSGIYSKVAKTRQHPPGLDVCTEQPFETLDQQYRDYIGSLSAR